MTDERTPDNPLLKQIDTLFVQLLRDRTTSATDNDVKFASYLADMVRLWAGIPIVPPDMLDDAVPAEPPPPDTPQTWADFIGEAQRNASVRRN
jgi:hypothetical protein